jgi:hypothetical protein
MESASIVSVDGGDISLRQYIFVLGFAWGKDLESQEKVRTEPCANSPPCAFVVCLCTG